MLTGPALALFVALAIVSYRAKRKEYIKRLVQPLLTAKQELDGLRRHWKKHEETYRKRNVIYCPLADPPGINEWDRSNFNEYVDKIRIISESECFTRTMERTCESLSLLRIPAIAFMKYAQNKIHLTGNDLDQCIQDLNTVLDQAINKARVKLPQ